MSPQVVIAVTCHWCSKPRAPWVIHQLATGQAICDYCFEWHKHALDFLGGAIPIGCQQCQRTWEQLQASAGEQLSMYVVPKDGLLQMLCALCAEDYLPKRKDLYRGTKFGKETLNL
ncbi:MAG TPA: hypothetical protein VN776_11400 [Terracidiphilus sp.]|nr:hypothetical protein [Terracidiphilus sp.]